MRSRSGNPWQEEHGVNMRVVEWIAPPGTNPAQLPALLENAFPGPTKPKLYGRGPGTDVHGFVVAVQRADGALYCSVCFYDVAFEADNPRNHGYRHVVWPALNSGTLTAMVAVTGEHPTLRLGQGNDDQVLEAFGFGPDAAPRRP